MYGSCTFRAFLGLEARSCASCERRKEESRKRMKRTYLPLPSLIQETDWFYSMIHSLGTKNLLQMINSVKNGTASKIVSNHHINMHSYKRHMLVSTRFSVLKHPESKLSRTNSSPTILHIQISEHFQTNKTFLPPFPHSLPSEPFSSSKRS